MDPVKICQLKSNSEDHYSSSLIFYSSAIGWISTSFSFPLAVYECWERNQPLTNYMSTFCGLRQFLCLAPPLFFCRWKHSRLLEGQINARKFSCRPVFQGKPANALSMNSTKDTCHGQLLNVFPGPRPFHSVFWKKISYLKTPCFCPMHFRALTPWCYNYRMYIVQ